MSNLPLEPITDVAELQRRIHELVTLNLELQKKNEAAQSREKALQIELQVLYARISELTRLLAEERDKDMQLALSLELRQIKKRLADAHAEAYGGSPSERHPHERPRKKAEGKPGRVRRGPTPQPKLPIAKASFELPGAERCCPTCRRGLTEMANQTEDSEDITVVRRTFKVVTGQRKKYRCNNCGHISTAPGVLKAVPGGRYDFDVAVHVAADKYADGMPLDRQAKQMARQGLRVTSQTLWNQIHDLSNVLMPVWTEMKAHVLSSDVIGVDERPWRRMSKGGSKKYGCWTATTDDAVVFEFLPTRGAVAAKKDRALTATPAR